MSNPRKKKTGTYIGKVCEKHPALAGKRYGSGRKCVGCASEKRKKLYASDKERFKKYARDYGKDAIDRIMEAYGPQCSLCLTTDREVLTIDHIHCDGSAHRRAVATGGGQKRAGAHVSMRNAIIKAGFPKDRYRILCFNCNYKAYLYYRRTGQPLMPTSELREIDWSNTRVAQRKITEWANTTFPNRTAHGALSKLVLEELPELLQDLNSPGEYADTLILLYDLASLQGIDIPSAIRDKMIINGLRRWKFDESTGIAKHLR